MQNDSSMDILYLCCKNMKMQRESLHIINSEYQFFLERKGNRVREEFAAYKINTQKSGAFLYVNNKRSERQKIIPIQFSRSVVSDSLQPHELQHTRPLCPAPTPGVHSNSRPSIKSVMPSSHLILISSHLMPSPPASNPSQHQSLSQ